MSIPFASEDWIKTLMAKVNESEAYRSAAKTWEGDFYFIVDPEDDSAEPVIMYMDLWHGDCRDAFVAESENVKSPEFRINAPLDAWQLVDSVEPAGPYSGPYKDDGDTLDRKGAREEKAPL